jgi:hypothetical protein
VAFPGELIEQREHAVKAVTATIVHEDPVLAGQQLAAELLDELGGPPDLVLLFASTCYEPEALLAGLWSRLPEGVKLAGCSSHAEINSEEAVRGSATAMAIQLDGIECEVFKVDRSPGKSREAGTALGSMVRDFGANLLILLTDWNNTDKMQVLLEVRESVGHSCPIVGGVASDELSYDNTCAFYDREALTGGIIGVALKGELTIASVARGGWQPIGAARTCTKVEERQVILELDGKPALDLYKNYLGEKAVDLAFTGAEFPIGVIAGMPDHYNADEEQVLLMRVPQFDAERQALVCNAEVFDGAQIRLTQATKDDLIAAAVRAVDRALEILPDPELALFFDCVGRKLVLGARYKDEIEAAFARLGEGVPRIGFYTYGEFAPVQGVAMQHNETFTLVLLKG